MKILVTGAGGQVGLDLLRTLQARGDEVHASDVAPVAAEDRHDLPWHRLDVTAAAEVDALVAALRPEVVFHLAAILSARGEADPMRTYAVNQGGTVHVLEGDFDTYFTLYAPKEYETDALYIFTPDVMQAAMDHGGGYDMEVVDDTFYVYTTSGFDLSKAENIQNLLEIVAKVGGEIAEQGDYYADERVDDRALNIVAAPGRRLRGNGNLLALLFVLIFMAIYVGIFLLN